MRPEHKEENNMDKLKYLKFIEVRFKKNFPNSTLMIGYDRDISKHGTKETWNFVIINKEGDDLRPEKIFESHNEFKEFDHRLGWHIHRMKSANEGIKNEIAADK